MSLNDLEFETLSSPKRILPVGMIVKAKQNVL